MAHYNLDVIRTGFDGFQKLVDFFEILKEDKDTSFVYIKNWIDANMCAPFDAVLCAREAQGGAIVVECPYPVIEDVLQRNGFLSRFGWPSKTDYRHTCIMHRHFEDVDEGLVEFKDYVTSSFHEGSRGLPEMSSELLRRFRVSIYEIFANAVEHSYTKYGVFTCGQYFPRMERLDFTIADLGVGIRTNIYAFLKQNLSPIDAIQWAFVGGNTTRQGRSGGIGLELLKEFITLNEGRLIVVSDKGYVEYSPEGMITKNFTKPFPGTVLTIEINTADQGFYYLENEIDPADIF